MLLLQDLLREIVKPLSLAIKIPTIITNNITVLTTAQNSILLYQNRHFLVKYYYLYKQIAQRILDIYWVATKEQLADILTKVVQPEAFHQFIAKL